MKRFENKVALVTGAGTGIGRAVAQRFANEGAKVLLLGRTEQTLQETAAADSNISYIVADIEQDAELNRVIAEVEKRYGQLDILVNNAGWAPVTPFSDVKMAEYDKVFSVSMSGRLSI